MIDKAIQSTEEARQLAEDLGFDELAKDIKDLLDELKKDRSPKKDWRKRPISPLPPRR